jgi:hypothetical protein
VTRQEYTTDQQNQVTPILEFSNTNHPLFIEIVFFFHRVFDQYFVILQVFKTNFKQEMLDMTFSKVRTDVVGYKNQTITWKSVRRL